MNDNLWFYSLDGGRFHTITFPSTTNATPAREPAGRNQRQRRRRRLLHGRGRQQTRVHMRGLFHQVTNSGATGMTTRPRHRDGRDPEPAERSHRPPAAAASPTRTGFRVLVGANRYRRVLARVGGLS
jgi:hypothetical protein